MDDEVLIQIVPPTVGQAVFEQNHFAQGARQLCRLNQRDRIRPDGLTTGGRRRGARHFVGGQIAFTTGHLWSSFFARCPLRDPILLRQKFVHNVMMEGNVTLYEPQVAALLLTEAAGLVVADVGRQEVAIVPHIVAVHDPTIGLPPGPRLGHITALKADVPFRRWRAVNGFGCCYHRGLRGGELSRHHGGDLLKLRDNVHTQWQARHGRDRGG